jgi:ribonuclease D
VPGDGPPPPRLWRDRDPAAAARLEAARTVLRRIAAEHRLPVENLLSPDAVRRLAWSGPGAGASRLATTGLVVDLLTERGARAWQRELVAEALTAALNDPSSVPPDPPKDAEA